LDAWCQQATTSHGAQERLGALLSDPHPAVRFYLAKNIITLWNHDRATMWRFAEEVVAKETNPAVMAQFVHSFLSGLRNLEPDRVESMVLQRSSHLLSRPQRKGGNGAFPKLSLA
jgi:hypothetical protein